MRGRAALLVAAMVVAGACGDGGGDGGSTPTTAAAPAPAPATDGVRFDDPEGSYAIRVPDGWEPRPADEQRNESWAVGPEVGGYTPEVRVAAGSSHQLSLDKFMDAQLQRMETTSVGLEVTARDTVEGPGGARLGRLHYSEAQGGLQLEFLGIYAVGPQQAVIALLSAGDDQFDALRSDVEPYLLTLDEGDHRSPEEAGAQALLGKAYDAARTMATERDSFTQASGAPADPASLRAIDPSVTFVAAGAAAVGAVSVKVGDTESPSSDIWLVTASRPDLFFCIHGKASGVTTFGRGATEDAARTDSDA